MKPTDPDESVMRQIANGDEKALATLMDRHLSAIHATSFRMLGDHMAAEDVAQLVFLKLWQTAPNWQYGRGTVRAYLYRMAHHRCLDVLRKRKEHMPGELPEMIDPAKLADIALSDKDRAAWVKEGLDQLSDNQRMALVLSYYQEMSLKQGAGIMEMSVAAFESLLRRARLSLKTYFTLKNSSHADDTNGPMKEMLL